MRAQNLLIKDQLGDLSNRNSLALVTEGEAAELLMVGVGLEWEGLFAGGFEAGDDCLS